MTWIAVRAIHFSACLLILGVPAFDRVIVAPLLRASPDLLSPWHRIARPLMLIALPLALLSGIAWFVLVTANMTGLPLRDALELANLKTVWTETQFGRVWAARSICWAAACAAAIPLVSPRGTASFRALLTWVCLIAATSLAGSLAWAGHGQAGDTSRWLHLTADVLHIVACGVWPAGLVPFAMLLLALRKAPVDVRSRSTAWLTRRFSAISLAAVAILLATGLINSWFLVGPIPNLLRTAYGKALLVKMILFVVTITLGAINAFHLKPRLALEESDDAAARRLRINVIAEVILITMIMIVVGVLGILPPAVE